MLLCTFWFFFVYTLLDVVIDAQSCPYETAGDAMNADALLELQNAAAMAAFTTAVMDACPHCGRTFIADRLKIHLRRYVLCKHKHKHNCSYSDSVWESACCAVDFSQWASNGASYTVLFVCQLRVCVAWVAKCTGALLSAVWLCTSLIADVYSCLFCGLVLCVLTHATQQLYSREAFKTSWI